MSISRLSLKLSLKSPLTRTFHTSIRNMGVTVEVSQSGACSSPSLGDSRIEAIYIYHRDQIS